MTRAIVATDELSERNDLASPAMPVGAAVWCHVPSPDRDIPVVATITNLGPFLDLNSLLEKVFGSELTATFDLKRPVDVLAYKGKGKEDFSFAGGIPIEDVPAFAAHTAEVLSLLRLSAGRFRVVRKSAPVDESMKCEVWQGAASVGARLVCASSERELELSGPFLVSSERVNAKTANVHLEMPHELIASLVREQAKEDEAQVTPGESAAERAGEQLGRDEAFALFDAVQSISYDLTLHDKSVETSAQIELGPGGGFLTRWIYGRSGPHPTVPTAFWSLPSDSDFAFYSEGIDEQAIRDEWRKLAPTIFAMSADEKALKSGQTTELSRLIEDAFIHAGGWELAYGQDLGATTMLLDDAWAKLTAKPKTSAAPPELIRADQQLGAWTIFGLDVGERDEIAAIRAVVKAGDKLPPSKDKKSESADRSRATYTEKPLKHPDKLPKGTVHLLIDRAPNKKFKPEPGARHSDPALPLKEHLVAVQHGAQLWGVLSNDEDIAVQRLSQVLAADPAQSVGGDAELKSRALTPPASFGFLTSALFAEPILSLDSVEELKSTRNSLRALLAAPNKGKVRMPLWLTTEGTAPRRIALHVQIPADAIADLVSLSLGAIVDRP